MYAVLKAEMPSHYQVYNIGNGQPVDLMHFISCLENAFDREAVKVFKEMAPGDIVSTWADTEALETVTGYRAKTNIEEGVNKFAAWFKNYHKIDSPLPTL
jgi:UDP-glucuronate 4-epimerase